MVLIVKTRVMSAILAAGFYLMIFMGAGCAVSKTPSPVPKRFDNVVQIIYCGSHYIIFVENPKTKELTPAYLPTNLAAVSPTRVFTDAPAGTPMWAEYDGQCNYEIHVHEGTDIQGARIAPTTKHK